MLGLLSTLPVSRRVFICLIGFILHIRALLGACSTLVIARKQHPQKLLRELVSVFVAFMRALGFWQSSRERRQEGSRTALQPR